MKPGLNHVDVVPHYPLFLLTLSLIASEEMLKETLRYFHVIYAIRGIFIMYSVSFRQICSEISSTRLKWVGVF